MFQAIYKTNLNTDIIQNIKNFLNLLDCWSVRMTTRKQLRLLSIAQLNDVGISEAERQQELAKPFWK